MFRNRASVHKERCLRVRGGSVGAVDRPPGTRPQPAPGHPQPGGVDHALALQEDEGQEAR